jgi:hypothetical protein
LSVWLTIWFDGMAPTWAETGALQPRALGVDQWGVGRPGLVPVVLEDPGQLERLVGEERSIERPLWVEDLAGAVRGGHGGLLGVYVKEWMSAMAFTQAV